MTAGDPPQPTAEAYVVPLPRATDALGRSLRRFYAMPATNDDLAALLRRLDTIH